MLSFLMACIHLDPIMMVKTGSYIGIALIVFAESGLLVGMFLPGDSLLFAAGLLAANGYLSLGPLMLAVLSAAILGDSVGYWFGSRIGSTLFTRKDSWIFKREYLDRTEKFYAVYGGRTLILARFLPIVRTLAPILAGASKMHYGKFISFNLIGAFLWSIGVTLLGYGLGSAIPESEEYIIPIVLVIVGVSFIPVVLKLARGKRL
jgi:membrane-associated protein